MSRSVLAQIRSSKRSALAFKRRELRGKMRGFDGLSNKCKTTPSKEERRLSPDTVHDVVQGVIDSLFVQKTRRGFKKRSQLEKFGYVAQDVKDAMRSRIMPNQHLTNADKEKLRRSVVNASGFSNGEADIYREARLNKLAEIWVRLFVMQGKSL